MSFKYLISWVLIKQVLVLENTIFIFSVHQKKRKKLELHKI